MRFIQIYHIAAAYPNQIMCLETFSIQASEQYLKSNIQFLLRKVNVSYTLPGF